MPDSIQGFSNAALAASYSKTAKPMLEQIFALFNANGSRMQTELRKLDNEVRELDNIPADNPQLQQTLDVYEQTLEASSILIEANGESIQNTGLLLAVPIVTAKVFPTLANTIAGSPVTETALATITKQLAQNGALWNTPDIAAIVGGYVETAEWTAKLEAWGVGYSDLARKSVLNGINQGWGPKRVASHMRQNMQNIPVHAANTLTKTLQSTSFREASVIMERANSNVIIKKIRVANLTPATCLNCIALHGTELEVGERVDDHFNGNCESYYVVLGGPETPDIMQADSTPGNRKFVPWQNGTDWFNGLSPERQAQQASFQLSPAKLRAFESGVPLSDFVHEHFDPLFGRQTVENSLVGAIGDAAEQFYTINQ